MTRHLTLSIHLLGIQTLKMMDKQVYIKRGIRTGLSIKLVFGVKKILNLFSLLGCLHVGVSCYSSSQLGKKKWI